MRPERLAPQTTSDGEVETIPVLKPSLPRAECLLPYLRRIDTARCYTNWGPLATELEQRLSERFGLRGGTVVSAGSGTSALVGAILARAGRATADRPVAIVPALTFVGTASAAEQCGYRIHLADVRRDDWGLDAGALLDHPDLAQTGLVVAVSPFGRPVLQAPWLEFQRRTGIPVVIDGAASFEALSAQPAQLTGEIPVALSFHATKAFATGEGGCIVTTDEPVARAATRALNFGFYDDRLCRAPSTNGKMSEYHAAVGLAELDRWTAKEQELQAVVEAYRVRFRDAGLGDRLCAAPDVAACYVLFEGKDFDEAVRVRASLGARGVECRSWYGGGVHVHPHFSDVSRDPLEVTERTAPRLIGLPVATDLARSAVARVVDAVRQGVEAG